MYPVPRLIIDVPFTSVVLAVRSLMCAMPFASFVPLQAMTIAVAKGDMDSLKEAELAMSEYTKLVETAKKRKIEHDEAQDNAPQTPRASARARDVDSPSASAPATASAGAVARAPAAGAVAKAGAAASAMAKEGAAAGAVAAARAVAKAVVAARAAAEAGAVRVVRSAAPRDQPAVRVRYRPAFPKGPNSFIGPMIRFPQDVGVRTITVK